MIERFFLCLLIPLKLFGEIESSQDQAHSQDLELKIDFSKMLSLTVEFPLGLSESNEEMVLGSSAIEHEKRVYLDWMEKHTFPWLKLLIMMGTLGIIWIIYLFSENVFVKKKTHISKQKPTLNQAIDYLINKHKFEKEKSREFYFELNKLLVVHLSEKTNLPLNTKTSNEIIQIVSESELFDFTQKQNLIYVLKSFENIKFAGKALSLNDTQSLIRKMEDCL